MIWTGRNDGDDPLAQRIFQRVEVTDLYGKLQQGDFALHGFGVDEGVKRNKGRVGASEAPDVVRRNLSNFPVVLPHFKLYDFGDIKCEDEDLEGAQNDLAEKVKFVLRKQSKSIVIGGGHEVTYGHYSGIKRAFPDKKIGIINIDAHFDNRQPIDGVATSGTGFWQIAQEGEINSLHIGIQRNSNTLRLFDTAHQFGMNYILAEEIFYENLDFILSKINALSDKVNILYLTICMDVFNSSIAPGVSASAYNGIFANQTFMNILRHILKNRKLLAFDIAEVNPLFDDQERTARLAASLINEWFMI